MVMGRCRLGLVITLVLMTAACDTDERRARDYLARSGYLEVGLEQGETAGKFDWEARRGQLLCVGRLSVERTPKSVTIDDRSSCEFDPASCTTAAPQVCLVLGRMHDNGDPDPFDPVPIEPAKAAPFFETSCRGGHAGACNALGVKYAEGHGVVRDLRRSVALFEKSCAGKHPRGCFNLGLSYHHGKGVKIDLRRGAGLYQHACHRGVVAACYNLGVCHRDGQGVPRDPIRAAHVFELACSGHHLQGCANLGAMLIDGESLPTDHEGARAVFAKACRGGLDTGCRGLAALPPSSEAQATKL
jgi:hypothetical protein